MRENTRHYFKFNRRIIFISTMLTLVFPGLLWYGAEKFAFTMQPAGAGRKDSWYVPRNGRLHVANEQKPAE
ncbi:hypothetical protein BATDEDRAFT_92612 [Batrachochytrium dendrobatidis JAM81]|uniref:Uncharacterized protein n=1 Tax=Batrachochytrium dendrobatidis (strain JAM81 / FGSC 10211) TaxID=684364 RepID=F4PE34_BATDJ|nr:uncharacterized protein BATDEDRAFT_92612 [Batrachochytrium dendrobatidis JAM81]EGF76588.1 hypothetical protein BATDEDRAFT_92612 [Batrachochytrium dendrobatidis JAM81]|eukprot:XP_006682920.1 hypothetical protein BATDEDRAFT_92612 [Batrachochytrium dendrobatidis JAM81]